MYMYVHPNIILIVFSLAYTFRKMPSLPPIQRHPPAHKWPSRSLQTQTQLSNSQQDIEPGELPGGRLYDFTATRNVK